MGSRGFWQELKRRHVYRVAAAYVIVGWLLIQVVTQVFPIFHLPDWIDQAVVLLILIGFPIALVLAWAFDAAPHGIVATDAATDGGATNVPLRRRSRRAGVAVGLIGVLIAVIAGGAYWHFGRRESVPAAVTYGAARSPDAAQRNPGMVTPDFAAHADSSGLRVLAPQLIPAKSIAVLPFENLSTDKGNAYFADGMQDLILTKLADIGDLKVISRTSTMQYGSHPENLKQIGEQLGVATILEGSVQKAGNQVLINVQLIDARSDGHIWAQSYQRTLDNIFGVEGEVAEKVANALRAKLTSRESTALAQTPTADPQAYDAYLHGLAYDATSAMSDENWLGAAHAYGEAVRLDPGFALAWARLSIARSRLYERFFDHGASALAAIKQAADKAFQLQPDLGEAWLAKAWYHHVLNDPEAELQALQQAQHRLPNNAGVLSLMGGLDVERGQWPQAIARLQQAAQLDPRNTHLLFDLGGYYTDLRQFAQACAAYDQALLVTPGDPDLLAAKAMTYQNEGDLDKAGALLQRVPVNPKNFNTFFIHVYQDFYQRHFDRAIASLQSAIAHADRSTSPYDLAAFYGLLAWGQRYSGDLKASHATAQMFFAQLQAMRKSHADDPELAIYLAAAYAELGDKVATFREADHARTLNAYNAYDTAYVDKFIAQFHAEFGDVDAVIAALPHLLQVPGGLTVAGLRLDPAWDPIRHDPRFQALLKKYAQIMPASAAGGVPVPASTTATKASDG